MRKTEKATKETDMKNFVSKPNHANLIAAFDRRIQLSMNAHSHHCFTMELPSRCVLQAELPRARNQEQALHKLLPFLLLIFEVMRICFAIFYALDTCCSAYAIAFHAMIALAPIFFHLIGEGRLVCLHLIPHR